jgi:hypothetical protein
MSLLPIIDRCGHGEAPAECLSCKIMALTKERDELKQENEILEACLKVGQSPCGHDDTYAYSDNGGKTIFCYVCRNEGLTAQLEDRDLFIKQLEKDQARMEWMERNLTWRQKRDAFGMNFCTRTVRGALDEKMNPKEGNNP